MTLVELYKCYRELKKLYKEFPSISTEVMIYKIKQEIKAKQ
jgi:hypothetical protein